MYREEGSAFESGPWTTDRMFGRTVVDDGVPYRRTLDELTDALIEARVELNRLSSDTGACGS